MLKSLKIYLSNVRARAWGAWLADPEPIGSPREVRLSRRLGLARFWCRLLGV